MSFITPAFETFPHAIGAAQAARTKGGQLKQERKDRRGVL
jgi:hypothetical protein